MKNPKYDKTRKYLDNDSSPEESREIHEWLCQNPVEPDAESALRDFWHQLPERVDLTQSRGAFEHFSQKIGSFAAPRLPLWIRLGRLSRNVAALLILPLTVFCFFLLQRAPSIETEWCEFAVAAGHTDSLTLPDNSRVWLNAGSRLIYPHAFGAGKRQVFLSGEAYFEVAKDAEHPFVVGTGDVNVRVLGTQFNVTSYENMRSVSVSLVEGSVSLDTQHNGLQRNMLLTPGDVVRFDKVSGALEQRQLPAEAYLSWRRGGFYFNNQPLDEIVAQFERVFGVKIFIASARLRDMRYTLAFVNKESLDQMLRAIAQSDDLKIVRESNMIVISAKHR